jgi:hypothetical protein
MPVSPLQRHEPVKPTGVLTRDQSLVVQPANVPGIAELLGGEPVAAGLAEEVADHRMPVGGLPRTDYAGVAFVFLAGGSGFFGWRVRYSGLDSCKAAAMLS